MADIPSLVMIFLLAGVTISLVLGVVMAVVDLVRSTPPGCARKERELPDDWWPRFEREFRSYAEGRSTSGER